MKTTLSCFFAFAILIAFSCNPPGPASEGSDAAEVETGLTEAEQAAYGGYLITIMGCHDCHSPKKMTDHGPEPDMSRMLSGHPASEELGEYDQSIVQSGQWALINGGLTAFVGPWGTTYSVNLTPHETGLGNWTYEHFKRALTQGKHKGLAEGRPIMPPMPWQNLINIKEHDLMALWTYLQSIPPIDNLVPEYTPPAPPPNEG